MSEAKLQNEIRLALGRNPNVVLFRNNVGVAKHEDSFVRYGVGGPGGSDLIGILAPSGRFIALEVKVPGGRVSEEQKRFGELIRSKGGIFAVVYSVDDALKVVANESLS